MIDTVILEMEDETEPGEEEEGEIPSINLKDYIPKISEIILKYNNIVFSLIKNKFNLLSQNKKSNYYDFINKLKQSINTLAAHLYIHTEDNKTKRDLIDTLEVILDNINNRTLEPVGIDDKENIQDKVDLTKLSRKQQKKINELNLKIDRRNAMIARERREEDARRAWDRNDEDALLDPRDADEVARERAEEDARREEDRADEDAIFGEDALPAEDRAPGWIDELFAAYR